MGKGKPAKSRARDQFIAQVKARMATLKLTQAALGDRLGVEQPYVSRLLSGRYTPSVEVMEQVAKAMGCELEISVVCT